MKLDELLRMPSAGTKKSSRQPTGKGRGRDNQSTGLRGISMRTEDGRGRRKCYQVFTKTTPAIYVGCAATLEEALKMQRDHVPSVAPRDCSEFPGVVWAGNNPRARVMIDGLLFQKRGFETPEDAAAWIVTKKAEQRHGN